MNGIMWAMPDRRFRKGSGVWAAPALRRNIEYMARHINNPQMYSEEALAVFNAKRAALSEKPEGESSWPAWYKFKNSPMDHQMTGIEKFFPLNENAIFFEQGLGKTYTAINLAAAWRMTNKIDAVVVVCPSSIKLVWEEELKTHSSIPFQIHTLEAGKYKAADGFLETRNDFPWFIAGIEAMSQGKAHEYIDRFMLSRNCLIIIDESSSIKTPGKTRTDRCVRFGPKAAKRMLLSGTSITQGLEDLYTQYKFLNPDIIGYDSYYSFRNHFCVITQMEVSEGRFVPKIIGYKNEDELMRLIQPYTLRVEKADALDLPEKTFTNRYCAMTPAQKKLYSGMKHEFVVEMDNGEYEVSTVLEQMLRLQQITGGHYPWDDGEKVTPIPIPGKNPKIEEMLKVMDEFQGKVIIWCQFRPEIELVAEALAKAGIQVVQFHGGCKDAEKREAINQFRKNPDVRVFLATRAAAYGLTLVEASTAIYYSQGYSLEQYSQSQDRMHRIGQVSHCNYIHLVCNKTVDTEVIKALAGKKAIADVAYSMLK